MKFLESVLKLHKSNEASTILERLKSDYRIGATRTQAVIFWQIDGNNKVRTGKITLYGEEFPTSSNFIFLRYFRILSPLYV